MKIFELDLSKTRSDLNHKNNEDTVKSKFREQIHQFCREMSKLTDLKDLDTKNWKQDSSI